MLLSNIKRTPFLYVTSDGSIPDIDAYVAQLRIRFTEDTVTENTPIIAAGVTTLTLTPIADPAGIMLTFTTHQPGNDIEHIYTYTLAVNATSLDGIDTGNLFILCDSVQMKSLLDSVGERTYGVEPYSISYDYVQSIVQKHITFSDNSKIELPVNAALSSNETVLLNYSNNVLSIGTNIKSSIETDLANGYYSINGLTGDVKILGGPDVDVIVTPGV